MTDAGARLSVKQQETWRSLVLAAQLLEATLDRQTQRLAGMPHSYYGILVQLYESEGHRARLSDLAAVLGYSQSRLTHAVRRMEASGWVERLPSPTDRRASELHLSHEGLNLIRRVSPQQSREIRAAVFEQLSDEQVDQLASIAAALRSALA